MQARAPRVVEERSRVEVPASSGPNTGRRCRGPRPLGVHSPAGVGCRSRPARAENPIEDSGVVDPRSASRRRNRRASLEVVRVSAEERAGELHTALGVRADVASEVPVVGLRGVAAERDGWGDTATGERPRQRATQHRILIAGGRAHQAVCQQGQAFQRRRRTRPGIAAIAEKPCAGGPGVLAEFDGREIELTAERRARKRGCTASMRSWHTAQVSAERGRRVARERRIDACARRPCGAGWTCRTWWAGWTYATCWAGWPCRTCGAGWTSRAARTTSASVTHGERRAASARHEPDAACGAGSRPGIELVRNQTRPGCTGNACGPLRSGRSDDGATVDHHDITRGTWVALRTRWPRHTSRAFRALTSRVSSRPLA